MAQGSPLKAGIRWVEISPQPVAAGALGCSEPERRLVWNYVSRTVIGPLPMVAAKGYASSPVVDLVLSASGSSQLVFSMLVQDVASSLGS